MLKTSNENLFDRIYDELVKSNPHVCLVEEDEENASMDFMSSKANRDQSFTTVCYNNTCRYSGYMFKILNKNNKNVTAGTSVIRMLALTMLFDKWDKAGLNVNHYAKMDPLSCSDFVRYLDAIGYKNADFIVIAVGM